MRKILFWCASLAFFGLAACDSSTSSNTSSTPSELVGIWKDSIPSNGAVVYLQLKSNGTGFAKVECVPLGLKDSVNGTWKASGSKLIASAVYYGDTLNDTATYAVSGSSLTLTGSKFAAKFQLPSTVFTKDSNGL